MSESSRKTLAICIPTHHGRARFVKEAIESILPQIVGRCEDAVQICVSDNGTSDATKEILAEYQSAHPNIFVIHRFDEDRQGRINLLKCISISKATFCWLFGSDDLLNPGAVDTMLAALGRHPETTGVTCSWRSYSFDMQWRVPTFGERIKPDKPEEYVYDSLDEAVSDLGIHFGYFSAQVFRRSCWDEIIRREGLTIFEYGHFILIYMIQSMIKERPTWVWLGLPLVRHRDQNMQVLRWMENTLARYFISVTHDTFNAWGAVVGTNSKAYRHLSYKWYKTWYFPKHAVLQWKSQEVHNSADDKELLDCMLKYHRHDRRFLTQALPELLVPHKIVKAVAHVHRILGFRAILKRLTMFIAVRHRVRGLLRILKIETSWTRDYDRRIEALRQIENENNTKYDHQMKQLEHALQGREE